MITKEKKILKIILSIILILGLSTIASYAENNNLDINGYIKPPSSLDPNGTNKITISSSAGSDYSLYYQLIDTNENLAKSLIDKSNTLKSKYEEIQKLEQQQEGDESSEELNQKKEEYIKEVEEYYNSYPKYIDSNWIASANGQVDFNDTSYTGKKYWTLWVKLVVSGETYCMPYIYTTEMNANEETNPDKADTEEADSTGAKIEVKGNNANEIHIEISNLNLKNEGYGYYYAITNSATKLKAEDINNIISPNSSGVMTIYNDNIKDYYSLSADMYISVKAHNNSTDEDEILINAQKVEKLGLLNPLGNRIKASISINNVSIIVNEVIGNNRKINIKIGSVTDKDLLNSIRNNENGWRQKLLEYAKKSPAINEQTVNTTSVNSVATTIPSTLNLEDGAYYFFYLEVDNENGKYDTVEDVYFTQAITGIAGSYLSTDYKFESDGNLEPVLNQGSDTSDPTVAPTNLPKTGEGFAIIAAITVITVLAIILRRKCIKYKGI